jgi:hypothetical protein
MPGLRAAKGASHRIVFRDGVIDGWLSQGKIIDGGQSRDPGNTGDVNVLRAGLLMGKISSSGKYAPSFVGAITGAYTSGGTTLNVGAAVAAELDRLLGQSGTAEMVAIGPPSANGTVAVTNVTHSQINTSTGDITVSSLGVNKVAGTLLAVNDGRLYPLSMIPDGFGYNVFDADGSTAVDIPFEKFPIAGVIDSSQLLPVWPSDTSIQAWIWSYLSQASGGKFISDATFA